MVEKTAVRKREKEGEGGRGKEKKWECELGADFSSIELPSISVLTAGDVLCGLP
jgi:hypothetical protein